MGHCLSLMSNYAILIVMKRILFFLIIFVVIFPMRIFADQDDPGGGGPFDPPPLPPGGGNPPGGGVFPTIYNPDIRLPTSAPDPDDPGAGMKWMYHCRYHECVMGDPGTPADPWLCSTEAEDVSVGTCWREKVWEGENIRERCLSMAPFYFINRYRYQAYNCFEDKELCDTFCEPWDTPDESEEVVYCLPGCRTCEVYLDPDTGQPGTLKECNELLHRLNYYQWPPSGENSNRYNSCGPYSGSPFDGFGGFPQHGGKLWCEEIYCPTRCGAIKKLYDECVAEGQPYWKCAGWYHCDCDVEACIKKFGLECEFGAGAFHGYKKNWDNWQADRLASNCLPRKKGATECAYMCDMRNLGAVPGCDGAVGPVPTPTGLPSSSNYYYCAGADGCVPKYGSPLDCMTGCGTQVCMMGVDPSCLSRVYTGDNAKENCQAGCNCPNPCVCGASTCTTEVCTDECGTICGGTKECGLSIVDPPGLIIENPLDGSKIGATDTEGRIHICDDKFWFVGSTTPPTRAKFVVTLSSARGADKIEGVSFGFTNDGTDDLIYNIFNLNLDPNFWDIVKLGEGEDSVIITPYASPLLPGDTEREITLDITFIKDGGGNDFPFNLNNIFVSAVDDQMGFLPWTYTDKAFKFWDCKVTYDGTLFDDSGDPDRGVCETHGYQTPASDTINFQSLKFTNTQAVGDSVVATVTDNTFTCPSGSELIWGKTYNSVFNDNINCDTAGLLARTIDLTGSVGTTSCMANSQINTKRYNEIDIPRYTIDPYVDSPAIKLDFSLEQFSDQWYQVLGGGVKAVGGISNKLNGSAYMVKNIGTSDAGWIAAGGTLDMGKDTGYSESDWKVEDVNSKGGFFGTRVSYNYFLNEFKIKKGIGTTETNWDNIRNSTGVFFVNGNLDIEKDSTPLLGATDYRIVIISGNLKIGDSATSVQGIYLADGNITIDGESALDAQLLINGILYSRGNISITRNFKTHSENNSKPAVKVTFDPNLIFRMPNEVYKVMSNWRQGI